MLRCVMASVAADIKLCPPGALGIGAGLAFEVVDSLPGSLPMDRSRVYVTGFSMGGAGTWHMIAQRPRFFAAAVPISGRGHPETAPLAKDAPVWSFHGVQDDVEPVSSSRAMTKAIRKAGGSPRHSEYPDLGHNAFAWAYTEPARSSGRLARNPARRRELMRPQSSSSAGTDVSRTSR